MFKNSGLEVSCADPGGERTSADECERVHACGNACQRILARVHRPLRRAAAQSCSHAAAQLAGDAHETRRACRAELRQRSHRHGAPAHAILQRHLGLSEVHSSQDCQYQVYWFTAARSMDAARFEPGKPRVRGRLHRADRVLPAPAADHQPAAGLADLEAGGTAEALSRRGRGARRGPALCPSSGTCPAG